MESGSEDYPSTDVDVAGVALGGVWSPNVCIKS
jgi:hypothetical protein